MDPAAQREAVSTYYGKTLSSTTDLKTSACCPLTPVPRRHVELLKSLHPEIISRFYGCGTPIPEHLDDCHVLDLGCGTGRDVYLASALVGAKGSVTGVDMTDEQLAVGKRHVAYHMNLFGFEESNVHFEKGVIEDLVAVGIADDAMDVVISNCVCNLSPQKDKVFSEVHRVLKPGGEFYFSDVYTDRRLSQEAMSDPELVGECLGGALYLQDFHTVMKAAGFSDIRIVSTDPVAVNNERLKALVKDASFYSLTVRAFKVDLENSREDYGHKATYSGEGSFKLDLDLTFENGQAIAVDKNTSMVLSKSRFANVFKIEGDGETHYGEFRTNKGSCGVGDAVDCFRPRELISTKLDSGCSPTGATQPSNVSCCSPVAKSKPKTENGSCCGPTVNTKAVNASSCAPKQSAGKQSCCGPAPKAEAVQKSCCGPAPKAEAVKKSCCIPTQSAKK